MIPYTSSTCRRNIRTARSVGSDGFPRAKVLTWQLRPAAGIGVQSSTSSIDSGTPRRRFIERTDFIVAGMSQESNTTVKESGYRDFVGGIQGDRLCASRFDCFVSQT